MGDKGNKGLIGEKGSHGLNGDKGIWFDFLNIIL